MLTHPYSIVVFITAPNYEEASRLAEMLVGERLAACVQIIAQMESVYRWQGRIERQKEVLLIAKTLEAKFEQLESRVREVHSYETPEIVGFPITLGSNPYLEWLAQPLMKAKADVLCRSSLRRTRRES